MLSIYCAITSRLAPSVRDQSGQGMAEYALILFLISLAAIAVLVLVGDDIVDMFEGSEGNLDTGSGRGRSGD